MIPGGGAFREQEVNAEWEGRWGGSSWSHRCPQRALPWRLEAAWGGAVCITEFPLMGSPQTDILGTGQKQQGPLPLLYCGCGSLNSSHSPNCLLCLLHPPFPASSPRRSQSAHQHSHLQSSSLLNNFSHLQQVKSFGEIRRENRRLALPRASDPVTMRCSETFLYRTEHKME